MGPIGLLPFHGHSRSVTSAVTDASLEEGFGLRNERNIEFNKLFSNSNSNERSLSRENNCNKNYKIHLVPTNQKM